MKELRITSSKIVVSKNSKAEKGYLVFHKVTGVLPKCRKVATLTFSPMAGYVWVRNLWSYNGVAYIKPEDWATLVKTSDVVSETLKSFEVTLTPEIITDAYRDAMQVVMSATEQLKGKCISPKYSPTFDTMIVEGK